MAMKQKIEITAKDKTKAAASSVKRSLSGVSSAASSMGAQLGLAFGVGGMAFAIKQSLDAADKIQKLSIRLGASTEALSQYAHVAELSGIRVETLNMGWQRMTRRVAEAAQGTGEARGALEELGLSAQSLNKLAPEDQFEALAEELSKVTNQADKVRLSMKLFDSEGVSLLQTMEGGAAGIREMREEADRLGLTLSRDQVNAAAAANDAITRMTSANKAAATQMAIQFAPTIEQIATTLSENLPAAAAATSEAFDGVREAVGLSIAGIVTGIIELYDVLEELPLGLGNQYARAKDELILFRESLFETIDEIGEKQKAAAEERKEASGGGSIITQILGTEEEMIDDMDRALDLIDKEFARLDDAAAMGIAGLGATKKKGDKKILSEAEKNTKGLVSMAQAGNKSVTELARNAAIEKAKIYAKEAIIGAYNWGAGVGGPIMGAAAAATASVAVGALVSALKGGGEGASAPAANVSSVPESTAPVPVAEVGTTSHQTDIIVSSGLHSDEDLRGLIDRINEVQQDTGGAVNFAMVTR